MGERVRGMSDGRLSEELEATREALGDLEADRVGAGPTADRVRAYERELTEEYNRRFPAPWMGDPIPPGVDPR